MDRRGIVILTSVEPIPVVLKDVKSKRGKNERGRSCSQVKKNSSDYFTVVVKPSGYISAEPAREQNRRTCCDRLRSS